MNAMRLLTAAFAAMAATIAHGGTVLYVDDDAPPPGNGLSWETAFNDLQPALDLASALDSGVTEIRVAAGIYVPSARTEPSDPRSATFALLSGVAIRAGYAGLGAEDPDERDIAAYETILNGATGPTSPSACCVPHAWPGCDDEACAAAVCEVLPTCCASGWGPICVEVAELLCGCSPEAVDAYHVVTGSGTDESAVLDGFTINGGNARFTPDGVEAAGGGLYILAGSSTVISCTFTGNTADRGAGMANFAASPLVIGCTFVDNVADVEGGGLFNSASDAILIDCIFAGNTADSAYTTSFGGGLANVRSNPTIEGCSFVENFADEGGGGIYNHLSSPRVSGCDFIANDTFYGVPGGAGMFNDASHPTVENCLFSDNQAWQRGGGMLNDNGSSPTVTDCVFSGNVGKYGGGMANYESDPTVTDCLFEGNRVEPVASDAQGGGIYNLYSSPRITRCDFIGNTATASGGAGLSHTLSGGGIYLVGGVPVLAECRFIGNVAGDVESPSASGAGGALLIAADGALVVDCTFEGNMASGWGGAVSSFGDVMFRDCSFVRNKAIIQGGGGLYFQGAEAMDMVSGCTFIENESRWGGGMAIVYGRATLTGCTFVGNRETAYSGGGVAVTYGGTVEAANCLFIGNSTPYYGGGLACGDDESQATLANCTFLLNSAHESGGGVYVGPSNGAGGGGSARVDLTNCILWSNFDSNGGEAAQMFVHDSSPEILAFVNYSCLEGLTGNLGGVGNTGENPLFVDLDENDLQLMPGSPCIDAGNNWGVPPDTADLDEDGDTSELTPLDLDGNSRFSDDPSTKDTGCGVPVVVDMGVYEFQGDAAQVVFADLTGDGTVGMDDLEMLLDCWSSSEEPCCVADLDLDGTVSTIDLLILLSNWG